MLKPNPVVSYVEFKTGSTYVKQSMIVKTEVNSIKNTRIILHVRFFISIHRDLLAY